MQATKITKEELEAAPLIRLASQPLKPNAKITCTDPLTLRPLSHEERGAIELRVPDGATDSGRTKNTVYATRFPGFLDEKDVEFADPATAPHSKVLANGLRRTIYKFEVPGGGPPSVWIHTGNTRSVFPSRVEACEQFVQAIASRPNAEKFTEKERDDGGGGMWSLGRARPMGARSILHRPASEGMAAIEVPAFEALGALMIAGGSGAYAMAVSQAPPCCVTQRRYLISGQCTAALGTRGPFLNASHLDPNDHSKSGALWFGPNGAMHFVLALHRFCILLVDGDVQEWAGRRVFHASSEPLPSRQPLSSLFVSLSYQLWIHEARHRAVEMLLPQRRQGRGCHRRCYNELAALLNIHEGVFVLNTTNDPSLIANRNAVANQRKGYWQRATIIAKRGSGWEVRWSTSHHVETVGGMEAMQGLFPAAEVDALVAGMRARIAMSQL